MEPVGHCPNCRGTNPRGTVAVFYAGVPIEPSGDFDAHNGTIYDVQLLDAHCAECGKLLPVLFPPKAAQQESQP